MGLFKEVINIGKNLWRVPIGDAGKRSIAKYENGVHEDTVLITCPSVVRFTGNSDGTPVNSNTVGFMVFTNSDTINITDSLFNIKASITYRRKADDTIVIDQFSVNDHDFTDSTWKNNGINPMVLVHKLIDDLDKNKIDKSIRVQNCLHSMLTFMIFMNINNRLHNITIADILEYDNTKYDNFLLNINTLFHEIHNETLEMKKQSEKNKRYSKNKTQKEKKNEQEEKEQYNKKTENVIYYKESLTLYFMMLELPKIDTNIETVKTQYRKLMKKYHPDTPGGNEVLYKSVQEAYIHLKSIAV